MKLQYLGHACFRFFSEMGTTFVCDPYNSQMVGLPMPKVRCDVVTMSHQHDDHNCLQNVLGNPAIIDCEISAAADDVALQSYPTFHDEKRGALRGKNLVFSYLVDGIKVVHMGDVGCLDEQLVAQIQNCDVLLVPVGGNYTVDCVGAKWYVDKLQPKIVIPMHYQFATSVIDVDGVEKFLQLFNQNQVVRVGDTLSLFDAPQNQQTLVYVMQMFEE